MGCSKAIPKGKFIDEGRLSRLLNALTQPCAEKAAVVGTPSKGGKNKKYLALIAKPLNSWF